MPQLDPEVNSPPPMAPVPPASAGKPDRQDDVAATAPPASDGPEQDEIDVSYWLRCLDDAERAERDWRTRGREITQIYRNEGINAGTAQDRKASSKKRTGGNITFNILYANTETMLPAIYSKPPEPIVRSRFTAPNKMPVPPMPMPLPGGPPIGGPPPVALPSGPPIMGQPVPLPGPLLPSPGPVKPSQKAIEAAASVMEKALEIVVDDELSHESVKAAIKDVLLPGRGTVRVRWVPTMETRPILDPVSGQPLKDEETGEDQTEEIKVWEEVNDEYVYWEDLLLDPVRAPGDMDWIAFRHLFTEKQLIQEFGGKSPAFDKLVAERKVGSVLCKWTEESAAKNTVGGGGAIRTADKLGDVIMKAMIWEIWDRNEKRVIWFARESGGLVMRIDPDVYKLQGFYPIPKPMLAVTTTDTQIPRPFYDLYANLANDLDETSARISNLTKQIKVRGGYNSASSDIAGILTADDQKMLPVDGVDMLNGGLQNHIWILPILEFMNALKELYLAREQIKQAIYEIMGISDIMRGATKASETATAQRIKGSMGMVRLSDQKQQAGNFVRDLLRLKGELIAQNFDKNTLALMTGEDVTDEVMMILRSDFMRTCTIDIEADSTVVADEQEEQQSMAMTMQSIQSVMTGAASMLATQVLPPPQVIMLSLELLKMFLHPVRYSRGVVELIDDFIEQLQAQIAAPPPMLPPPPPGANVPPGGPPPGNGARPSAPPGGPPDQPPAAQPGPPLQLM